MKSKIPKRKQRYFYINTYDSKALWYTVTIVVVLVLLAMIIVVGYEYTKTVFIPELKIMLK